MNRFLRDLKAPEDHPKLAEAVKCARVLSIIDEAEKEARASGNVWMRASIREVALRQIKEEISRKA